MNDFDAVKEFISKTTGIDVNNIEPDYDLTELGLNNLDFAELLYELEEAFDVIIDDDNCELHTLNDIINHIVA